MRTLSAVLSQPAAIREAGITAEAFDEIIRQHQRQVYRVISLLLKDTEAADTLTQECFLRAYQKRHTFRIDYQAELQKQDLKLQDLLDEDDPNENQVGAQVDRTLAARANLEREFTMMNLALRKVLTVDQWKQLKAIQSERRGLAGPDMFFDLRGPGGAGGPMDHPPKKLWAAPPPDAGEGSLMVIEPPQTPDI